MLNLGAIKLAISMHGKKYVKMAIDRALEVNKADMTYINGILKNWRREGYPKEKEVINNGVRSNGKSNTADKNEFANSSQRNHEVSQNHSVRELKKSLYNCDKCQDTGWVLIRQEQMQPLAVVVNAGKLKR